MDLIDAPAVVAARVGGRVAQAHELGEKLPRLLAFDDARKRRVLTEQADAGVEHHGHEEASLALGEAELSDGLDTLIELHQMKSPARSGSRERLPVRALDPP